MRERQLLAAGGGLMPGFAGVLARLLGSSGNPKLCQLFRCNMRFFGGGFLFCFLQAELEPRRPGRLPALPLPVSACLKADFAFATSSLV